MNTLEKVDSVVPDPIYLSDETIARLRTQEQEKNFKPLVIIEDCEKALSEMPEGKTGVVIGSGENTERWKQQGWKTLDIDTTCNPDYSQDANMMTEVISPGTVDFIYAEELEMDKAGKTGVSPARILQQANAVLNMGGKLIIKTAHLEIEDRTKLDVPDRHKYIKALQAHGFHGIAKLGDISWIDPEETEYEQEVIYYGEKVREGFKNLS